MTATTQSRKADVEAEVGMTISEYLHQAVAKQMSFRAMARELGVTELTLYKWAKAEGYYTIYPIRKKR